MVQNNPKTKNMDQQNSCMQMKKTKPLNLKFWTIRIICKLITIYRTVENLRHNHPSIGTNMCWKFRLRKQNAALRDAVVLAEAQRGRGVLGDGAMLEWQHSARSADVDGQLVLEDGRARGRA